MTHVLHIYFTRIRSVLAYTTEHCLLKTPRQQGSLALGEEKKKKVKILLKDTQGTQNGKAFTNNLVNNSDITESTDHKGTRDTIYLYF